MKKISFGIILLVGFISATAGSLSTASASCYGASCEYKDPTTEGCDADKKYLEVAHVLPSRPPPREHALANVYMWYSTSCNTKWAEIDTWYDNADVSVYLMDGGAWPVDQTHAATNRITGYTFHTRMTEGSRSLQACGTVHTNPPFSTDPFDPPPFTPESGRACTGYH